MGVTSGFSNTPPSTIATGPDVGISPHAVDWLAAEAVECHIEIKTFSAEKSHCDAAARQTSMTTCFCFCF